MPVQKDDGISIFYNESFGNLRTVMVNNEPWLVAIDVTNALGYKNCSDALAKHVDDDDKDLIPLKTSKAGNPIMAIINESGLYSLVFSSHLPNAKKFRHWVTSEVLPSLRKNGVYAMPKMSTAELLAEIAQQNVLQERRMLALEKEQAQIKGEIEEAKTEVKNIHALFQISDENWRSVATDVVKAIARQKLDKEGEWDVDDFKAMLKYTWTDAYNRLETRSGVRLGVRQKNRSKRIGNGKVTKLQIVGDDKKLKHMFMEVIRELALAYKIQMDNEGNVVKGNLAS